MYCLKCGYKIPAGAAFCPNCGAKVQAAESARPAAVPSEAVPQSNAVPPAGPSVPPAASQSAQNNAQPAGDPLAVMVGKHADYYLAEFKKIDAGQKPRFNWAAFLLGPMMCFYRRSGELFKKYFLPVYIALLVSSLVLMVGMSSLNGPVAVVGAVLALAAGVWGLVNAIRFAKNFNRDYYAHCKQQLAKPASERKSGTSIKNIVLFLLALTGVEIVFSIVGGLLAMLVLSATLNSAWEDEGFYSEDTYSESSSYYDEADSYIEEEPASSAEQTPHYEVGSKEILENAWSSVLANSNEPIVEITFIYDDCDDDGLYEAFAATAEEHDEDMDIYFGAKIYFIDSYGNVTLLCDTAPEGGPLYGKPNNLDLLLSPDNIHDFFVWDVYAGTSAPSLVWGVHDGQVYESNISGQYCSVHWAEGPGLAGYQVDYSQGYRDDIIYRLNYDSNTASFTAVPDNAAYPEGEEVYLIQ